ncbi:MAG: leucyl aminopeptidase [Alphaproteobacteria bacterium]
MKIAFSDAALPKTGAIVVLAVEGAAKSDTTVARLTSVGEKLDSDCGGAISRAIGAARFKGGKGKALSVFAPVSGGPSVVVVAGLGRAEKVDALSAEAAGGAAYAELARHGDMAAILVVELPKGARKLRLADFAANIAFGARLRSYRFDKYRTKEKPEDKPKLATLTLHVRGAPAARRAYAPLEAVGDGVFLTRNLASEPANVIYPESLAQEAQKLGKLGVKVEVLDEKKMKQLGFGALLGVAQGSARPPRFVVMRWSGGPKTGPKAQPIAILGKGVTFDSGGISIKPSKGMEDMKWDMGGAGVVIGLMKALAGRKARANVVGLIGCVENMPSGTAQRPGDIVKSYSGQTIEVLNTDAEGRLVLADALWYCQEKFKPRLMIDLATLTGAIIVALGHVHAGLFSNNDRLARQLEDAGKAVGERLWRLPLDDTYDRAMDSKVADVQNISSGGGAGSITAAQFLQRFVNSVTWAHLDIAGVTWSSKDEPTVPRGGTGFGVRLLDRLIATHYEGR